MRSAQYHASKRVVIKALDRLHSSRAALNSQLNQLQGAEYFTAAQSHGDMVRAIAQLECALKRFLEWEDALEAKRGR